MMYSLGIVRRTFSLTLFVCLAVGLCASAHELRSPDGQVLVQTRLEGGAPEYCFSWQGEAVVNWSGLGLAFEEAMQPKWEEKGVENTAFDASWKAVWGKRSTVRNHYQELTWQLKSTTTPGYEMQIVFRAYDDGMALRYVFPEQECKGPVVVKGDRTEFDLAKDMTAWSYNGETANRGPESIKEARATLRLPVTLKESEARYFSIMEAAIYGFGWIDLRTRKGDTLLKAKLSTNTVTFPFASPWRVIMAAKTPGALVDSDLLENLNPPCAIEDPSWIKPGVAFWDWRAWGYEEEDFRYGLDMATWKRFIDLAQETKVPYLVLDANWYGDEFTPEAVPTTSKEGVDVPALIRYGKERGVDLILYLNDVAGWEYGLEPTLKTYAEWGAAGVKYGFLKKVDGQAKVARTREIVRLCAQYKLLVLFHDNPVPPCGDMRTWPNHICREYCHAQSDAHRVFTPTTFCTTVFVNMLTGPLDMNNGMFQLHFDKADRPRVFENIPSTILAEAARTLIVYSGLTIIPDAADVYRKHPELFGFVAEQETPWLESRTLAGEIGEYIVMMRQTDSAYLIASATNEEARTISIPLDFLDEGVYEATIFSDGAGAHYETKKESYEISKKSLSATDTIEAVIAPGSGHCVILRPKK